MEVALADGRRVVGGGARGSVSSSRVSASKIRVPSTSWRGYAPLCFVSRAGWARAPRSHGRIIACAGGGTPFDRLVGKAPLILQAKRLWPRVGTGRADAPLCSEVLNAGLGKAGVQRRIGTSSRGAGTSHGSVVVDDFGQPLFQYPRGKHVLLRFSWLVGKLVQRQRRWREKDESACGDVARVECTLIEHVEGHVDFQPFSGAELVSRHSWLIKVAALTVSATVETCLVRATGGHGPYRREPVVTRAPERLTRARCSGARRRCRARLLSLQ